MRSAPVTWQQTSPTVGAGHRAHVAGFFHRHRAAAGAQELKDVQPGRVAQRLKLRGSFGVFLSHGTNTFLYFA